MCLDFSNQHPHLLVIGSMDGAVAVYNIMLPPASPQYKSNDVDQKHGGIVWEVIVTILRVFHTSDIVQLGTC